MSKELHQSLAEENPDDVFDGVDNELVETIWHELDKQVSRERVGCVVSEVAIGFQDASVKTFLSIFIPRRALEQLQRELNQMPRTDHCLLDRNP